MLKKLPAIFALLILVVVCGAALVYGIGLLRDEDGGGLGEMLTRPERLLYPYDLDERPKPATTDRLALLPETLGAFRQVDAGLPGAFATDLGMTQGLHDSPIEAIYASGDDTAHVILMRCDSPADTKERLAVLRDKLVEADGVKTYRAELVGAHPYVKYRYGGWGAAPHGLAWGNGEWLFFVFAETGDALDVVAGELPY